MSLETDLNAQSDLKIDDINNDDEGILNDNVSSNLMAASEMYDNNEQYPFIYYDWMVEPFNLTFALNEYNSTNTSSTSINNNNYGKKQVKMNNFLKGCKWSPDGSCIITNSEDKYIRLFNLPSQLCSDKPTFQDYSEMTSVFKVKESDTIYDYCWFPTMNSSDPNTCFFATTSNNNPVHLWDAYSGQLVCSYICCNYADEVIGANCIALSPDGTKLFCGFDKTIRIFHTNLPGRECQTCPTNDDKQGQFGIISCICFNPTNYNIYAAGSYSKTIGIYDQTNYKQPDRLCIMVGQKGGVTHLMFSNDGTKLYSGGRKDCEILCWDIRNLGNILQVINRNVLTNQRIYFDISPDFNYLSTGNNDGMVTIFDITKEGDLQPIKTFKAHNDCVNGVSFHPTLPLLASASGQRKFTFDLDLSSDEDQDQDQENSDKKSDSNLTNNQNEIENCLKLWWCADKDYFETKV